MKKLVFIFVLAIIIPTSAFSQGCLSGGITFSTQAEIDAFQTNYPNCSEIQGNVTVEGSDITNLNGMNALTSFGGDLYISNNDSLTDLTGLESITYIGSHVVVYGNDTLTSLTGLEGLTSIGGELDIGTAFGGNPALTSLTGLEGLTSIGSGIFIRYNDALTSLTGLDSVSSIAGLLGIVGNPAITSLSGLDNIDAASIDDLRIYSNSSLSTCDAQSVCDYLSSPGGTINIHDNEAGCNNQSEVEASCLAVGIDDFVTDSKFSIYPNPTTGQIRIDLGNIQVITMNVLNALGVLVHTEQISAVRYMDYQLPESKGLYLIQLASLDGAINTNRVLRE